MDFTGDFFKLFKSLVKDWLTLKGLLLVEFILFFIVLSVVTQVSNSFLPQHLSFQNLLKVELVILASYLVIWFLFRYFKGSVLLKVKKKQINVGVCIECDKGSKGLYTKAIETFKRKFEEIDTDEEFNIFEIANSRKFSNSKAAERFADREGINLLIWGHTEQGRIQNIDTTIFNLKFSYNFITVGSTPEEHSLQHLNFTQDIDNALIGRVWKVTRPDTLPELRVVSENLSEVSLYIIIKVLASYGLWAIALKYCDDLLVILRRSSNQRLFPGFSDFEEMIKQTAAELSNSISYYYLIKKKDLDAAKKYATKASDYVNNYFPALINLANIAWSEGNKSEAKRFTKIARKQNPSSTHVRLNRAFFSLEERRFKQAVAAYKRIRSIPKNVNIFDTTTFLYSLYETKEEPAYLFGSGYLNFWFGDEVEGRGELKRFLQLVDKTNTEYVPLINYASGILISK